MPGEVLLMYALRQLPASADTNDASHVDEEQSMLAEEYVSRSCEFDGASHKLFILQYCRTTLTFFLRQQYGGPCFVTLQIKSIMKLQGKCGRPYLLPLDSLGISNNFSLLVNLHKLTTYHTDPKLNHLMRRCNASDVSHR